MKYIHSLYIGLLSLLFVGCQEEQLNNMQTGGFLISLNDDVSTEVTTKSTPAELGEPATENFKLKIVNETTNDPLYDGAYKSGPIPASAGTYTVTASFGDNSLVALDEPYYKGEETGVVVEEGKTTSVQLACKVANALASVIFPDATEMAKIYESYWVKVAVENYSVKLKPNSTNSAYFQVGKEVSFYFEGEKLNGQSVSAKLEHNDLPTTFEAADHYTLTLTFNDDLTLDISKVKATTATIYETIPMEWLPKPKVEAEGFIDNTLTFVETETPEASIKLNTASALQDLKLKFNFQDEQFQSSLQTDKEYLLSNTEDRQAIETALGITLPEIGTTDASLDLSPLLAKLQTNAGETTKNSIEIDAKANNRWSSEEIEGQETPNLKYTLKCVKPEFSVSVQKENCWSREFTINEVTVTSGNVDIIKNNLVYQYYNEEKEKWIDCVTREDIKGRTQQFTDAAEDLTTEEFKVRALYRGTISSTEATVILETPTQLPNSGMEEWSTIRREEFRVSDSWSTKRYYYSFYPYISNETDIWWNTNNDRSQDGNIVWGVGHPVCFAPCVSYTENEKHSDSRAALIYTSGHGGGYASTGEMIYEKGAFAGSLFIGTYSWNRDNGETITKGHTFSSRPTTLKFWYNYVPKNTDTFQAYVELKNGDELVGLGTFTSSTSNGEWKEAIINIEYVNQPKNATSIYVQFLSTTKTSFSESDFDRNKGITFPVMGNWNAHIGSMLYIDDISLVYDK